MPPIPPLALLALMLAFAAKHFVADFVLQSPQMVVQKGRYGQPLGLVHAGVHSGFSFALLVGFGMSVPWALILSLAEFVLHYHIDFAKEVIARQASLTPAQKQFWILFGFDQFLHHVTYAGMIFAALLGAG